MITVFDEKSVPSSNNVDLKSVSAVSLIQVSVGCEWTIVSVSHFGNAPRGIFVFSGRFVNG